MTEKELEEEMQKIVEDYQHVLVGKEVKDGEGKE